MKKMNLSFLGLKAKMVLPLFLLIGLFLVSANTSNAQVLSSEKGFYETVVKHVQELPVTISMTLPILKSSKEEINNPQIADDAKIMLDRTYGELVISFLEKGSDKSQDAIDKVYDILLKKIPTEYLNPVREVYKSML